MAGWSSKSVSTGPRPEERWRSKSEIAPSTTSADATVSSGPSSRSSEHHDSTTLTVFLAIVVLFWLIVMGRKVRRYHKKRQKLSSWQPHPAGMLGATGEHKTRRRRCRPDTSRSIGLTSAKSWLEVATAGYERTECRVVDWSWGTTCPETEGEMHVACAGLTRRLRSLQSLQEYSPGLSRQ